MSALFASLDETGHPQSGATAVVGYDENGELCCYKGVDLAKVSFAFLKNPICFYKDEKSGLGEFVSEPQGLPLSFVVAYDFAVAFPTLLTAKLHQSGLDGNALASLSQEALFRNVLASCFAEAMSHSFQEGTSLSVPLAQANLKRAAFAGDYLKQVNLLTYLPLGIEIKDVRFGVCERSSLKNGISQKKARAIAQKAGH
jgi:hypothetical protein